GEPRAPARPPARPAARSRRTTLWRTAAARPAPPRCVRDDSLAAARTRAAGRGRAGRGPAGAARLPSVPGPDPGLPRPAGGGGSRQPGGGAVSSAAAASRARPARLGTVAQLGAVVDRRRLE